MGTNQRELESGGRLLNAHGCFLHVSELDDLIDRNREVLEPVGEERARTRGFLQLIRIQSQKKPHMKKVDQKLFFCMDMCLEELQSCQQ